MAKLAGKVAIVTGGGQGIGRGIALAFAREGARVVIAEMNSDTGKAVAKEIRELGGEALAVVCDVRQEAQVRDMVSQAVQTFGGVDVLVNNAQAALPRMSVEEGTDEWWNANFDSGPRGTWYCCKAVFPHMKGRGGKIINVSSTAGMFGGGDAAYSACKEAIRGFTRRAAREWGRHGIAVNALCPLAATPGTEKLTSREHWEHVEAQTSFRRWGDPDKDIAPAAVFLASQDAGYITGQTLVVDGGMHMV